MEIQFLILLLDSRGPQQPLLFCLCLFLLFIPYSKQKTERSFPSASLSWDSMTQVSFLPNSLGSLLTPQRTSAFYNFSSQTSCCCPTGMKWENRCRVLGSEAHGRVTTERKTRLAFGSQRETFSLRDSISKGEPKNAATFVSPWVAISVLREYGPGKLNIRLKTALRVSNLFRPSQGKRCRATGKPGCHSCQP